MAVTTLAVIGAVSGVASIAEARNAGRRAEDAALEGAAVQSEANIAGQEGVASHFDVTQANLQPFQEAGVAALGQQQALLGLSGQEAQQTAFAGLNESPGQEFLRQRQQRALVRNASAIGGLGGGNVRTALQQQAVGFAQQDIENQFGRLGTLAGRGQTAATNVGQFGERAAVTGANFGVAGAEARASGIFGATEARAKGRQNTLGAVGNLIGQFG